MIFNVIWNFMWSIDDTVAFTVDVAFKRQRQGKRGLLYGSFTYEWAIAINDQLCFYSAVDTFFK